MHMNNRREMSVRPLSVSELSQVIGLRLRVNHQVFTYIPSAFTLLDSFT